MRKISIFIRTRNEVEALSETIAALRSQNRKADEIIVLDNESDDDTVKMAGASGCIVQSISRSEFSYGRALNRALTSTRGDIIVFISAHTRPITEFWLDALLLPLDKDVADASYGRQEPVPGVNTLEEWSCLRAFPRRESELMKILGIQSPVFSNANAAATRSLLEKERFREDLAFAEDKEWAGRILGKGYKIVYCPEALVSHSHDPAGVEERMLNVGIGMRQRGDGAVYRSLVRRSVIRWCTMVVDLSYCMVKGRWSVIPSIGSYRRRYFAGLAKGVMSSE